MDVIITGNAKPAFLLDARLPIYRCDPEKRNFRNADGFYKVSPEDYTILGKCFQYGNYTDLHVMLVMDNGTQVLYAGDHNCFRHVSSKRKLDWETLLVVLELWTEVIMLNNPDSFALEREIQLLRNAIDKLDQWVDPVKGIIFNEDIGKER